MELSLGQPLDKIPENLAYLQSGGPSCPKHVSHTELYEHDRSAGVVTKIIFVALVLASALFLLIAIRNFSDASFVSMATSLILFAGFSVSAILVFQRIGKANQDIEDRKNANYRLGLYLDGKYLILRYSSAFSVFPKVNVSAVRVDSRYNSETKHTQRHLVLSYVDDRQLSCDLKLEFTFSQQQGSVVALIQRWLSD